MLPDAAFHLIDPKALENLHQSALDGMALVLAEKLNEFMDANPGVKPDHLQGGFKGEAQQRVNERKLKLSKQLRAYVRTPRMANEMHA